MRRIALVVLTVLATATPVAAQLNTYYKGIEYAHDKEVPATARFSLEKGRVAMIVTGARPFRVFFVEKEKVLRVVDDAGRSYMDFQGGIAAGMTAEIEEQLGQLSADQRMMVQEMMEKELGSAETTTVEYLWSKEKKTVAGYECTRVDVRRGDHKKAEYWGTPSDDFKISEAERKTVKTMHEYLSGGNLIVRGGALQARAFQWDTSADGYPLITRCFEGGKVTLDLTLASFDRKAVPDDLFKVPKGYKRVEVSTDE